MGFAGDEDEDDCRTLPASVTPGFQGNFDGKNFDWQDLVPTHKRSDPDIVAVIKWLEDIEPQIKERMKVVDELWKARHPSTGTLDVDHDELLKEFQQRFSGGDKLVEPTLICLRLNKARQELVFLLRKAWSPDLAGRKMAKLCFA
ncbi:hypothetical protein BDP27DRAFT_1433516 [Rhodocollybia butyracea]|uniref:Uncharacterized protein n=1 Tax=Rhodocollybia butyracea TaxID=206335 RepID=A0A9P5P3K7_9AGAR|nr:hypothetical protein BDP27DRAFT_1433516 [Rhodocollybia butyracea]